MSRRESSPPFHRPEDADDPLLRWLRQDYLFALSREARGIPESLKAVLDGRSTFEDWLEQVYFCDKWLLAAARFTLTLWREHGYDGVLRMPGKAVEISHYGVPGMLRINLAYAWMPHRGHRWAKFRQCVMEEVEQIIEKYRRDSMEAWGKQRKHPSFKDLQLLARYQANQVRNPDESEYKRIGRTAEQLGLTLRPKNKRTKKS